MKNGNKLCLRLIVKFSAIIINFFDVFLFWQVTNMKDSFKLSILEDQILLFILIIEKNCNVNGRRKKGPEE